MIPWFTSALAGPAVVVDVPFPSRRVFDDIPDKVCLELEYRGDAESARSGVPGFDIECNVLGDVMSVCMTLLEPQWPSDVPTVQCGADDEAAVKMRPVAAYDPTEQIWDGVALLQRVMLYKAAYRAPGHPDVHGIMDEGKCGITEEIFWFETRNRAHRQSCILVMEDDSERVVPIRLVQKLRRHGR